MGYREQKIKIDEKLKRVKRICLCIFVFLLVAMLVFSFFYPPESWKYYFSMPEVGERKENEMRVHFIDVGQGDCIVVELPDGKTMLVDGGGRGAKTEKAILRYLNALKIDVIDYLVVTHTDSDHCGAIGEIVRQKRVLNAYLPTLSNFSRGVYAEAYAELLREDCTLAETKRTLDLSQDGGTPYVLSFLYPYTQSSEKDGNAQSAVFWLDYMGASILFTGDMSAEEEELLIRDASFGFFEDYGVELSSTEILKVAHHGSALSSSMSFLNHLNLEAAVISCGRDNAYGHPADIVLDKLDMLGADVYRTDENGHVILTVCEDGTYFFEKVES